MSLADFVHLEGYKVAETYKHLDAGYVLVAVEPTRQEMACKRCGTCLQGQHSQHRLKAKFLPLFTYDAFIVCWRRKGFCPSCKKIRSEEIAMRNSLCCLRIVMCLGEIRIDEGIQSSSNSLNYTLIAKAAKTLSGNAFPVEIPGP